IAAQFVKVQVTRIIQSICAGAVVPAHDHPNIRIQDIGLLFSIMEPPLDHRGLLLHVVRVPSLARLKVIAPEEAANPYTHPCPGIVILPNVSHFMHKKICQSTSNPRDEAAGCLDGCQVFLSSIPKVELEIGSV